MMGFHMTEALQSAIKAYQELRGSSLDDKPEGVGEEWWQSYSAARDAATPDAPRGERGVSVHVAGHEGPVTEEVLAQAEGEVTIKIYGFIERWTLGDFDYYLSKAGSRPVRVRIAFPRGRCPASACRFTR